MAKNGKKSNKLAELGKERGYLTSDEISSSLSSGEIDSEDVNSLIEQLENNRKYYIEQLEKFT